MVASVRILCIVMLISLTYCGNAMWAEGFQDRKFTTELHSVDSPHPITVDQETVSMTDRDGRKYICAVTDPALEDKQEGDALNMSSVTLASDARGTKKTPEDLLEAWKEAWKDQCPQWREGWWTYELCFSTGIKQFRRETVLKKGDVITQEFSLGQYDEEATSALHREKEFSFLKKDPRSQSATQRYHARLYTNGTRCDLTDEPRQTEVRFTCSSDTGILYRPAVKEASSCKYIITFDVPVLCEHPLFREEQVPWTTIHCNELAQEKVVVEVQERETGLQSDLLPFSDEVEAKDLIVTS